MLQPALVLPLCKSVEQMRQRDARSGGLNFPAPPCYSVHSAGFRKSVAEMLQVELPGDWLPLTYVNYSQSVRVESKSRVACYFSIRP